MDVWSVPFKFNVSQYNVPSKYPSLNSNDEVPRSTSLSDKGAKTPSVNLIWSCAPALNVTSLSVPKSISLSASLPITKLVFNTEVIAVSAPPVNTAVPPTVIASASKVPSKYPSLNWRLDVPKSISSSATGANAPLINLIWLKSA